MLILIRSNFNKKFFTNHSLHVNGQGKEKITIPISWTVHNDANCNDNHDEYSDLPSSSKKHSCDITSNHTSNGKERNLL